MNNGPTSLLSPNNAHKLRALHELAKDYLSNGNSDSEKFPCRKTMLSPQPIAHMHGASRPGVGVKNALALTKDSWNPIL